MIDNGYLFAKDNKRIFINTSLGCAGNAHIAIYQKWDIVIVQIIIGLFQHKL